MAGYAWKGVCYQDTASALDAFTRSVLMVDASGINVGFYSTPTITSGGLISYAINNRQFTDTGMYTRSGTVQLPSCSAPGMDQWSVQSFELYAVLFFACFLGFRSGFRP